jgi:hypothetical protein
MFTSYYLQYLLFRVWDVKDVNEDLQLDEAAPPPVPMAVAGPARAPSPAPLVITDPIMEPELEEEQLPEETEVGHVFTRIIFFFSIQSWN